MSRQINRERLVIDCSSKSGVNQLVWKSGRGGTFQRDWKRVESSLCISRTQHLTTLPGLSGRLLLVISVCTVASCPADYFLAGVKNMVWE